MAREITTALCASCGQEYPITQLFSEDDVDGCHCVHCVAINIANKFPDRWVIYAQNDHTKSPSNHDLRTHPPR